jgi:hypothetical protein
MSVWCIKLISAADHFTRYAPEHIEYGVNRYQNETRRLYSVLDKHLASDNRPYLCGEKCTIAGKFSAQRSSPTSFSVPMSSGSETIYEERYHLTQTSSNYNYLPYHT